MSGATSPSRSSLALAPPEYSQQHMNALIRQLELIFNQMKNPGPITCAGDNVTNSRAKSGLNIQNIPTSATGLKSGDVWSDSGTLKIVS